LFYTYIRKLKELFEGKSGKLFFYFAIPSLRELTKNMLWGRHKKCNGPTTRLRVSPLVLSFKKTSFQA